MIIDVHIRQAEKSDIPQLVDLMNCQYKRRKDEKYFLWQYFNSYYPTVLFCAFAKGKLIGMYGLQKRLLNNGTKAGQAIDMLISQEFRGKGVFKRLVDKAIQYFQDIDMVCVFPNLNGRNAVVKCGWESIGKIDSMCGNLLSKKDMSVKDLPLSIKVDRNKDLVKFVSNSAVRHWRFAEHPDYSYSYVRSGNGAFAVTKIFIDPLNGHRFGDIVDYECENGNESNLMQLFLEVCYHFQEHSVHTVTTWGLPHTLLYKVLKAIGFSEISQERYFCVKVLNLRYTYLYDLTNWHLVQADTEIY